MKLTKNFKSPKPLILTSDLKVDELMEVGREILLKTYDRIISLRNPNRTWKLDTCSLEGYKLFTGKSITLTQE